MADSILTQAEIDELLNALSAGNDDAASEPAPEKEKNPDHIKIYNFKTANRFTKEQVRTFNIVYQTFCRLFSNRMTAILRTACECEVLSVEEISFNEFNNSLPAPVVLVIFKAAPMAGSQILEISPEVAYMIINRLFGGTHAGSESSKMFTEIELALMERVMRQSAGIMNEAWEKVLSIDSKIERVEMSPQFAQVVAPNEPVAVVTMNVSIGEESGLISICIPHTAIEPVAKQMSTRLWYAAGSQEPGRVDSNPDRMRDQLVHTPVTLTAYFEETAATIIDIVNLQVGDVIRLSQKTSQPVSLKVQHIPKFRAKVGISDAHYAVQIVDVIREDEGNEPFTR